MKFLIALALVCAFAIYAGAQFWKLTKDNEEFEDIKQIKTKKKW